MKFLQIFGDTHGRTNWQQKIDLSSNEKIVFLGDYVDSFHIEDMQIINNLKTLIQLKKDNRDKIELLLGNHDLMYYFLGDKTYMCSGFRRSYSDEIHRLFYENKQLFNAAYQEDNWLFTHAGLSRLFLKKLQTRIPNKILKLENKDYATYLNEIFRSIPSYLSDVSFYRGGLENWGGPFWMDQREYSKDSHIKGLNQIVGHQPVPEQMTEEFGKDKIIWIDTESHPSCKQESMYSLSIQYNYN